MRSHRVSLGHARAGTSIAGSCPTLNLNLPPCDEILSPRVASALRAVGRLYGHRHVSRWVGRICPSLGLYLRRKLEQCTGSRRKNTFAGICACVMVWRIDPLCGILALARVPWGDNLSVGTPMQGDKLPHSPPFDLLSHPNVPCPTDLILEMKKI